MDNDSLYHPQHGPLYSINQSVDQHCSDLTKSLFRPPIFQTSDPSLLDLRHKRQVQKPPPLHSSSGLNREEDLEGRSCRYCNHVAHGRNWRQDLARHVLKHTGEKPFKCPVCPHRSTRAFNLRIHLQKIHLIHPDAQPGFPGERDGSESGGL